MTSAMNSERLDKLRKLHELDPRDADVCYMIAQEHGKAGEHDQALAWYDKCLAADASYCYAYFFKAMSLKAQGDTGSALATIDEGLAQAKASNHGKALSELTQLREQYAA